MWPLLSLYLLLRDVLQTSHAILSDEHDRNGPPLGHRLTNLADSRIPNKTPMIAPRRLSGSFAVVALRRSRRRSWSRSRRWRSVARLSSNLASSAATCTGSTTLKLSGQRTEAGNSGQPKDQVAQWETHLLPVRVSRGRWEVFESSHVPQFMQHDGQ